MSNSTEEWKLSCMFTMQGSLELNAVICKKFCAFIYCVVFEYLMDTSKCARERLAQEEESGAAEEGKNELEAYGKLRGAGGTWTDFEQEAGDCKGEGSERLLEAAALDITK